MDRAGVIIGGLLQPGLSVCGAARNPTITNALLITKVRPFSRSAAIGSGAITWPTLESVGF